jgi:2-desacetyl-2-hydroxyethyl bacteriochlorophyllide A dehydrogenase
MTDFMTAARLHRVGARLRLDSVRVPSVGANDVLVDVRAAGICHSDLNYVHGLAPVGKLPITLGHEISGIVAKVGSRVKSVKRGDRVFVHYVIHCGLCVFCQTNRENYCNKYQMMGKDVDGGLAEYTRVPVRSILKLPQAIPFEQGAILGCAVPTAFHALMRGRVREGDTVVVFGVGGLGVHAIQLARKIFDAGNIIAVDLFDKKLKLAKQLGASNVVNAARKDPVDEVRVITEGRLADVVLDFVGHNKTISQAIDCAGRGGRVVLVGIGAKLMRLSPYRTVIGKEMELIGVNDHLKTELVQLAKFVGSGKIDLSRSVTHKISLMEVNLGMRILEENIGMPVRVVVSK